MTDDEGTGQPEVRPARPWRLAALAKQVPVAESLELGGDGRLKRAGAGLEMNPYCRRAVSKGVELAQLSKGTCTVLTLGPPSAEDVLRESVAWGADRGIHLCDEAFAGSDTLATARTLAAVLQAHGPFDLVLVGRNSIDGDTGQVGPELAELLDRPFAGGVRQFQAEGELLHLTLEQDDGWREVELALPAVLSVAERLCDPCKVDPEARAAVPGDRLVTLRAVDVGPGPWGQAGSPTRVGAVRSLHHERRPCLLAGDLVEQVDEAVRMLRERRALSTGQRPGVGAEDLAEESIRSMASGLAVARAVQPGGSPIVAVVLEPGRDRVGAELLGAAGQLAREIGAQVVAVAPAGIGRAEELGDQGVDEVVVLVRSDAEGVAATLGDWARRLSPWAILAPSTDFGREVASRVAASLGAGLVGDAVGIDVVDGVLVAAKPAFSGAMVADITSTSPTVLVTVRPGVLDFPPPPRRRASRTELDVGGPERVRILAEGKNDDVEVLARAEAVIGVGTAVLPNEYQLLSPLAAILGAELAATRKVTDKGWAPRARQVGITGRSIAPRLYVAIGLSGKFNHMVGVRGAGTILAINADPGAPVFGFCDVGMVADWHDVLPLLEEALRTDPTTADRPGGTGGPSPLGVA